MRTLSTLSENPKHAFSERVFRHALSERVFRHVFSKRVFNSVQIISSADVAGTRGAQLTSIGPFL